jgi:hypothetical protein
MKYSSTSKIIARKKNALVIPIDQKTVYPKNPVYKMIRHSTQSPREIDEKYTTPHLNINSGFKEQPY